MKTLTQTIDRFAPLTMIFMLTAFNTTVTAQTTVSTTTAAVTQYSTITPDPSDPELLPLGYHYTARSIPQVIMAGVSPSIIDAADTSFEILALVRPSTSPLQSVTIGQGANPFFTHTLTHINTLANGDQFWKTKFEFPAGSFGNTSIPIKWGNGDNQFYIRATDATQQSKNANAFPSIRIANAPAQTVALDTSKTDQLSYNATKRYVPQIIMAGVSPAIVDILDTSFDVVTILRPGIVPIKSVTLKQSDSPLFGLDLEKKKTLSNGDQIWVANYAFPRGTFSVSTVPIVWGMGTGEFNILVTDIAQQNSTAYPVLRSGNFAVNNTP